MRLVLVAATDSMAAAWQRVADERDWVKVHRGDILDLAGDCDAFVSPANSFGYMRGGIDAVYARYFGPSIEDAVRRAIESEFGGELPVGEAVVVPTGSAHVPFLIAAPTMRTPMRLPDDTRNPFLAARAVLRLMLSQPDRLAVVALPGLGTGVGGVAPERCADQVAEAIGEVFKAAGSA